MPGRPDATAPSQFFNVSTFFESIAAGKAWPRKAELTEVSIAKAGAGLAELGPADASRKGFALVGRQKPMSRSDCTQGNYSTPYLLVNLNLKSYVGMLVLFVSFIMYFC